MQTTNVHESSWVLLRKSAEPGNLSADFSLKMPVPLHASIADNWQGYKEDAQRIADDLKKDFNGFGKMAVACALLQIILEE